MNKRLLLLSGIAIIAVIANHASHIGFVAMFWWTDRYLPVSVPNYDQMGSLSYYALVAQQKLALFSVPAFLLVSGAFIAYSARGSQSKLGWSMIRSRILKLLPPYIFWTFVFILVNLLLGRRYSIGDFILSFVSIGKSPFFFVPLLIVYFLLSPPLAYLAKTRWKLVLLITILIQVSAIFFSYLRFTDINNPVMNFFSFLLSEQIVEFFFFYALGLIVGFRFSELKQVLFKIRWGLLFFTLIFAALAVIEAEWIFQRYDNQVWRTVTLSAPTYLYCVSFIFCFLSFEQVKLPFSDFIYRLGVDTLAVYLIHPSVLMILPKIIYHLAPFILGYQILYQPLLISLAVGIPLFLMDITKRTPIRVHYRLLFG